MATGYQSSYTGAQVDAAVARVQGLDTELAAKVDKTTTINNEPLSGDITLTASEVGAMPDTTKYARTITCSNGVIELKDQDGNSFSPAATATITGVTVPWGSITGNVSDNTALQTALDALQTNIDGKQATITGAATTITSSNLTNNRALVSNGSGKVAVSSVTNTELGYLSGTTSSVQEQLNSKITEEDLTDVIGDYAQADLSNLTNLGDGVNRAVKGYNEDGNLIYDRQLVNDVTDYARSTFDLSKFTTNGSAVISDSGIASNFSANDWVNIPDIDVANYSTWEVFIPVNLSLDNTTIGFFSIGGTGAKSGVIYNKSATNQKLIFYVYINSTTTLSGYLTREFDLNKEYVLSLGYNGSKFEFKLLDNEYKLIDSTSVDSTVNIYSGSDIRIGLRQAGTPFTGGSSNLKKVRIVGNGVEVFNGNKTGIDTIKPDDYTVVGTPTISADGVFTSTTVNASNYVQISNLTPTNDLRIELEFKLSGGTYQGFLINDATSPSVGMYVGEWGVTWALFGAHNLGGRYYIQDGHSYKLYLEWKSDGTTELGIKRDDVSSYSTSTGTWTDSLPTLFIFGYRYNNNGVVIFDLNRIKVYSNGNLVYQPCLKIPYTESAYKHGSKIVDMQYLPRVKDAYEQGYPNRYYALQEDYRPNYSVVGTPTIAGTQVSSFSASNYLTKTFSSLSGKALKIQNRFLYDSTIDGCISHGAGTNNSPRLTASATNQNLEFYFRGTSDVTFTVPYSNFTANTWYNTEAIITPTKQIFQVTDDNGNVVFKETKSTTQTFDVQTQMATYTIGYRSSTDYFSGTVDLAGFKIFVDGNFVGSPVIAPCVALPMGDIYGQIGQRILRASGRTGARYWELYSDRTLEQGGHCENGVVYTFDRPFANDTDFIITIPYSAKTATSFTPSQTGDFIAKGLGNL